MSQGWTRRELLAAGAALAMAAPARGLAEDKPRSLVYGTYGSDYSQWMKTVFETPFTAATGVAIVDDAGGDSARYAKMKTFRDAPKTNIQILLDRYLFLAAREGLFEELAYARIPNAAAIPAFYRKPHWFAYCYTSIGIVYNTTAVSRPPRNWEDFLDDRYRGKFFIDDFTHFGLHALVALALANGGSYDNIEPGFRVLRQMKERLQPRFVSHSPEGMKLLATGEVIGAIWQDARIRMLKQKGSPVEYVTPETGDVAVLVGHGIVKGSAGREWSERFLNHTADPKLQGTFASTYIPVTPTHPQAVVTPEAAKLLARPPGAKQFSLDWDQILPRLDEWTKRWNKEIAS